MIKNLLVSKDVLLLRKYEPVKMIRKSFLEDKKNAIEAFKMGDKRSRELIIFGSVVGSLLFCLHFVTQ